MTSIQNRMQKKAKAATTSGENEAKKRDDTQSYSLGKDRIDRVNELTVFANMTYPSHFLQQVIDLFQDIDGPFDIRTMELQTKPLSTRRAA